MTFLHAGLFAAGLAAVSIPILIHLLMRRRRKPVQWGAMRFLMEAYKRTRRRLLVQRWLLLAARCLILALLAFALGRPLLGALIGDRSGGRTIYFLIDNSLTSAETDETGKSALSRHLDAARSALRELGDGDRAGLILLGAPAERTVIPPTANLPAVRDLLEDLAPTDSRADLPGALAAVASSASENPSAQRDRETTFVVILSDYARGSADLESTLPRLPANIRLISSVPAASHPRTNVTLRSATPLRSTLLADQLDQTQTLAVKLSRSGPAALPAGVSRILVRLESASTAPGTPGEVAPKAEVILGESVVNWTAGQSETTTTIALDTGVAAASWRQQAKLGLPTVLVARIDNDSVAGDNIIRTPIEVRDTLRVGLIGPIGTRTGRFTSPESLTADQWMRLALRPREDAAVEMIDLDPATLDPSRVAGIDAFIVTAPDRIGEGDWPRLRQAVELGSGSSSGGGLLLVMPPGDKTVHSWTDAMTSGLGLGWTIAREARVLEGDETTKARLGLGTVAPELSLLGTLRAELGELARPINFSRILPVVSSADATTELAFGDGTGVIWTTALGERKRATPSTVPSGTSTPGATTDASKDAPAQASAGRGVFIYVATSLDLRWTDLPVKPLMVPLVQELLRQGVGKARSTAATIAGQQPVAPPQSAVLRPWAVAAEKSASRPAPADNAIKTVGGPINLDQWGLPTRPIRESGVWDAIDSTGGRRGILLVNPSADAGNTNLNERPAVEAWLAGALSGQDKVAWLENGAGAIDPAAMRTIMTTRTEGRPTPAILLAGVLLLALAEMALARVASHAGA